MFRFEIIWKIQGSNSTEVKMIVMIIVKIVNHNQLTYNTINIHNLFLEDSESQSIETGILSFNNFTSGNQINSDNIATRVKSRVKARIYIKFTLQRQ
jgi:hypothetical protein